MMPKGQRVDDQPENKSVMFRLALAARKYPVQIALIIALVVLIYPVSLLIDSNSDLKDSTRALQESNRQIKRSAADLRTALNTIQTNRQVLASRSCKQANKNASSNNAQTTFFQHLIIQSVVDSRAFDKFIKQIGAPPYDERLKKAKAQARELESLKVPLRDCDREQAQIEAEIEQLQKGKKPPVFDPKPQGPLPGAESHPDSDRDG